MILPRTPISLASSGAYLSSGNKAASKCRPSWAARLIVWGLEPAVPVWREPGSRYFTPRARSSTRDSLRFWIDRFVTVWFRSFLEFWLAIILLPGLANEALPSVVSCVCVCVGGARH